MKVDSAGVEDSCSRSKHRCARLVVWAAMKLMRWSTQETEELKREREVLKRERGVLKFVKDLCGPALPDFSKKKIFFFKC